MIYFQRNIVSELLNQKKVKEVLREKKDNLINSCTYYLYNLRRQICPFF